MHDSRCRFGSDIAGAVSYIIVNSGFGPGVSRTITCCVRHVTSPDIAAVDAFTSVAQQNQSAVTDGLNLLLLSSDGLSKFHADDEQVLR